MIGKKRKEPEIVFFACHACGCLQPIVKRKGFNGYIAYCKDCYRKVRGE